MTERNPELPTTGNPESIEPRDDIEEAVPDRMLKWFEYGHLPQGPIQNTSIEFNTIARWIVANIKPGPERTVALRKLLEAKDAAVRAVVHPGG